MSTDKPKLTGGVVPGRQLSEFDKFAASNLDKAIISNPIEEGKSQPNTTNPSTIEMPVGVTPEQAIQLQSAFKAIMSGQALTPATTANPIGTPPPVNRDMIIPDNQTRMWNPNTPFQPTARLSQMEASLEPGRVNPTSIIVGAPVDIKLKPKDGCSPVLIDAYVLFKGLLDGRWLVPGCPRKQEVESMLLRLQSEVEDK